MFVLVCMHVYGCMHNYENVYVCVCHLDETDPALRLAPGGRALFGALLERVYNDLAQVAWPPAYISTIVCVCMCFV
jgi:hypothetical protein